MVHVRKPPERVHGCGLGLFYKESRRSMSGGMLVHNGALLRFWSRKQKVVALSSRRAMYAGVMAGVEAIGLQSGLADFGMRCQATPLARGSGWRSTSSSGACG